LLEKSLLKALVKACDMNRTGALIYLDLDNFKAINDTFGHAFGDTLLKKAGETLQMMIPEGSAVYRFGGDEFIILIPETGNSNEVEKLASQIIKSFQKPWYIDQYEFFCTVSIGICVYPENGQDINTVLKNAETSMYSAKEAGKNTCMLYTPNMNQALTDRLETESNLRHAIQRDEFILHYQPQVCLRTGDITGVEALIRWNHPTLGMIPPARFIPIAEDSGMIKPIGEWVLKTACRQGKIWQDMGYKPVRVSVNLSARQFQQPDLKGMIRGILTETGLEPKWLNLEVTESTAMKDLDFALRILSELRNIGISISLDDFGTGYSSLNYLRRLPIDTVKIDKSFVNDIKESSAEETIAQAVISLAHKMNLTVVAEGIETAEQLLFLQKNACDTVQGYYFSRPQPPDKIDAMFGQGMKYYCNYPLESAADGM
jgi:polar amino acid transport system substrate-binding protein